MSEETHPRDTSVGVLDERTRNIQSSVNELKVAVLAISEKIESRFNLLDTKFVVKEEYRALEERVRGIQGGMTWGVRIVLGLVLVAIVGTVIAVGGGHLHGVP